MSNFLQQPSRMSLKARLKSHVTFSNCLSFAAVAGLLIGIGGCGSNLRPTVTPIPGCNGSCPDPQPSGTAFVISTTPAAPGTVVQGNGTVIDYSGDTVMATAPIGPNPEAFNTSSSGNQAWTINSDGTVSNIPVSITLQQKNVTYSTLNQLPTTGPFAGINPVVALYAGTLGLYALDDNLNQVDVLTGSPDSFKLVVPVDQTPVTLVGASGGSRFYAISQLIPYGTACNTSPSTVGVNGVADGIENSPSYTVSSKIPVGVCPVYGIASTDTRRVFVLNRGSDTISVINSQLNTIDSCTCPVTGCLNQSGVAYTCHPTLPLSTTAVSTTGITPPNGTTGMAATAGPVYGEYNPTTQQLVVSNYDGNTISIIDVSLDQYGNDSPTFGTTFTVPVGTNPASVTVLADGSRAYVANQSDGTVTIVDLTSHSVENTLSVFGHPRTVVSTVNSIYGKVYVAAPDSPYVTIIRTDQDIISTTVLVQGNAIDVRISSPDTINNNLNTVSRMPGAGQPCNLPLTELPAASITPTTCRLQDTSFLNTGLKKK
jgi:YVTN family beta-propeller protein